MKYPMLPVRDYIKAGYPAYRIREFSRIGRAEPVGILLYDVDELAPGISTIHMQMMREIGESSLVKELLESWSEWNNKKITGDCFALLFAKVLPDTIRIWTRGRYDR